MQQITDTYSMAQSKDYKLVNKGIYFHLGGQKGVLAISYSLSF